MIADYLSFIPVCKLDREELVKTYKYEHPVEIPIDYLWAAQDFYYEEAVREYVSDSYVSDIEISVHEDKLVVYDGHHRLLAAYVLGQKSILGIVVTNEPNFELDLSNYVRPDIDTEILRNFEIQIS